MSFPVVVAAAAAVAGVGVYSLYLRRTANNAETAGSKGTFSSFGFTSLRLQSAEMMNHNTRRLRFELPDPNATSGLSLTSATLTISFPNGRWLPVLRPYTPVSELG
jgi:cytochrome-b5 reductase